MFRMWDIQRWNRPDDLTRYPEWLAAGHENACLGSGVENWSIGDRVFGIAGGVFATRQRLSVPCPSLTSSGFPSSSMAG